MQIGWSWRTQWTGFSQRNKMKDALRLLDIIHLAYSRPEYAPHDGVTYCNRFVSEIVSSMGFKGLEGLLANDMIDLISKHDQWTEVAMEKAQDLCNDGSLIVAGLKDQPHGHVSVCCPGKIKNSGRWGLVPSVASVGAKNFIGSGLNWAYSNPPTLWVWRLTL